MSPLRPEIEPDRCPPLRARSYRREGDPMPMIDQNPGRGDKATDATITLTLSLDEAHDLLTEALSPDHYSAPLTAVARRLREKLPQPEPTKVGAVVKDVEGAVWVRTLADVKPWGSDIGYADWVDVPAPVEVLSEGVDLR